METIYDWLTVIVFAVLIVVLLQRSVGPPEGEDKLYHYFVPAIGCGVANYLGNSGQGVAAILVLAAGVAYALYFLRPRRDN